MGGPLVPSRGPGLTFCGALCTTMYRRAPRLGVLFLWTLRLPFGNLETVAKQKRKWANRSGAKRGSPCSRPEIVKFVASLLQRSRIGSPVPEDCLPVSKAAHAEISHAKELKGIYDEAWCSQDSGHRSLSPGFADISLIFV